MIKLIATAHISERSVKEVEEIIKVEKPDLVAVELCESRYRALTQSREIPIFELIKQKKVFLLLANTLLSFLQRKMGEKVGVEPGTEMLRAIEVAKEIGAEVAFIDRDLRITLKRALSQMSILEKAKLLRELVSVYGVEKEDIEKELEKARVNEELSKILKEFKCIAPNLYRVLVEERDAYMAYRLIELQKKYPKIIAVVGAGHKEGIEKYLSNPSLLPSLESLLEVKEKKLSILKLLKFAIPLSVLYIFGLALYRGISIRGSVLFWAFNHMIPTFVAVLLARGSIFSAIVGMVASPLTSLNPLIAAGWFAGLVELKVRKVTVGDISEMFRVSNFSELMSNKAFRVLLVTAFANVGSMLGTFISFPTIIIPLLEELLKW